VIPVILKTKLIFLILKVGYIYHFAESRLSISSWYFKACHFNSTISQYTIHNVPSYNTVTVISSRHLCKYSDTYAYTHITPFDERTKHVVSHLMCDY